MNKLVNGKSVAPAEGTASATTSGPVTAAADVKVAYHDGPPTLTFYGRRWSRGVGQTVTADVWAAMQARADCAPFDFRVA